MGLCALHCGTGQASVSSCNGLAGWCWIETSSSSAWASVIARRCLPRSRSPMRSACCTPSRRECRGGAVRPGTKFMPRRRKELRPPRNEVHAEEAHRFTAGRVGHRADTQWHSEAVHRMTSCRRRHHGSMPSRCENPSLTGLRRSVRTGASQLRLAMTVTTCVKAIASPLGFGLPPCHICTGTGLTPPTFAPGLGSPLPHLHRDWDPAGAPQLSWLGTPVQGASQGPQNWAGVPSRRVSIVAKRFVLQDFESPSPRVYATAYVEHAKPPRATLS